MVTRGTKSNFVVGERVLCYEPDPTKAKVLYDSKVLEVIAKGNKRGRKQIEYLIHFHRWNHSWDRCVPEELVLKDTEENRQLQKILQEKSQQQLKLNRRKLSQTLGRTGFDDDDNSNTFPEMHDDHDMDPSTSDSDADDEAGADEFPDHLGRSEFSPSPHFEAHIEIPPRLKDWLTEDYNFVREQGRLHKLPAQPCVSEILEMAVRDAARNEASAAAAYAGRKANNASAGYSLRGPKKPAPTPSTDVIVDLSRRLNLIHEVADGLRIYFDYILGTHLLYKEETAQFLNCDSLRRIVGDDFFSIGRDERVSMELKMYTALAAKYSVRNSESELSHSPSHSSKSPTHGDIDNCADEQTTDINRDSIDITMETNKDTLRDRDSPILGRSPKRFKEDKCKPQHLAEVSASTSPIIFLEDIAKAGGEPKRPVKMENKQTIVTLNEDVAVKVLDFDYTSKETGPASPKSDVRRLRSHKILPTTESSEEIVETEQVFEKPCEKLREPTPEKFDTVNSPNSASENPVIDAILGPVLDLGSAASTLNEKIVNWRIIPEEGCGFYPCKIYGATHLARLFVKLPDFLNATKMDEQKLKSLLSQLQMFTDYLEEHPEWFGDFNYFDQPAVPPETPAEAATEP